MFIAKRKVMNVQVRLLLRLFRLPRPFLSNPQFVSRLETTSKALQNGQADAPHPQRVSCSGGSTVTRIEGLRGCCELATLGQPYAAAPGLTIRRSSWGARDKQPRDGPNREHCVTGSEAEGKCDSFTEPMRVQWRCDFLFSSFFTSLF